MLEARVDQIVQFEEKIHIVADELNKVKGITQEFQKNIIVDITKTNELSAKIESDLRRHIEDYKSSFMSNQFY